MTPRLGHFTTRFTAAIILLSITGMACLAEDAPPRTKITIMKAGSDTQQGLAGNLKASVKPSRGTIMKTKHDTVKNSISNVR